MMDLAEQREQFEFTKCVYESSKLKFHGVDGFDVYNTSIPFQWEGKQYLFGRVERRNEWARSWVRLFENTGEDEWTAVSNSPEYQLEDPYVSVIHGFLVLGGTHVRYTQGRIDTFYDYFYRGKEINNLYYFTTGPENMKDIRLVEMKDKKIGVFSRPRGEDILEKYGSESLIGFTVINSLDDLTPDVVQKAEIIDGLFDRNEWGGCNQVYCLSSGLLGVIGHKSLIGTDGSGRPVQTYMNISFVFDPAEQKAMDLKIIGTRDCYPAGPSKRPSLADCAFTSGIVLKCGGKADLYSGIGDCEEGRVTIDYPFQGFGEIVSRR
jgi:hypothetical protein